MPRPARWLPILGMIVLVAVAAVRDARAQASPPSRFFGSLTIDGAPAGWGTVVVAEINGRVCSIRKDWPGGPSSPFSWIECDAPTNRSGTPW